MEKAGTAQAMAQAASWAGRRRLGSTEAAAGVGPAGTRGTEEASPEEDSSSIVAVRRGKGMLSTVTLSRNCGEPRVHVHWLVAGSYAISHP